MKHKAKGDMNITGRSILARGRIATAFLLLCLAFLAYRLAKLQMIDSEEYRNAAIRQYTTEITIYAKRGDIYDRNMKLLATSSTVQTVFISPKNIETDEQAELIENGLVRILGANREDVAAKIAKRDDAKTNLYQVIKRNVEETQELELRDFISKNNLSSQIHLEESTKRYYPYGNLASQTLGFVGMDNNGLNGVELTYDSVLNGINGRAIQGRDGLGNELPFQYESYIDALDGTGVVLTTDYTIESILRKYLQQCVDENQPVYGARGIIMDPNTGEILAMASIADYDPNKYTELCGEYLEKFNAFEGTDEEKAAYKSELMYEMWKNKCATELYEPGSTFKIITTAIGLEEGIFTMDSHYNCSGVINVLGIPIHCHSGKRHGDQTVAEAILNSCNPAFVQMGIDIGGDIFSEYFEAFGYTKTTGSDVLGEAQSMYYENLNNQLTLANCAFGQSMAITMLQHISATSAIANGGYVVTPHIIKSFITKDKTTVDTGLYNEKRQVISEQTAKTVLTTLINSTKNACVSGYNVSSKTGTSQKLGREGAVEGENYYISSCVTFAPAEDPQLAILIVVDEPTGGVYYGSQVAAPVISNILSEVLPYLKIKSNDANTIKVTSVEDYKKTEIERAKFAVESAGFKCVVVGNGTTVIEQMPRMGSDITEGGTIILYTEENSHADTVKLQSLKNMTPEQVFEWISDHKLNVAVNGIYNRDFVKCFAVDQSVPAGTEVPVGTVIDVTFIYEEVIQ